MTSANEEEHMRDLRFAGWFSKSNLIICKSANLKFNSGLNGEPVQVNKNLLDG